VSRDTPGFEVAPWELQWRHADPASLSLTESAFALCNGHIGLRGTLEEGEPVVQPGTYLNGFYELRELPYAESGYAYPESGQTVVNVTDGKIIRLLVEDQPIDLRYGRAEEHERTLDFRSGTLRRRTVWESPTGRRVRITSERLVSFTKRTIAAIRYSVEPMGEDLRIVLQVPADAGVAAHRRDRRGLAVGCCSHTDGRRSGRTHHPQPGGPRPGPPRLERGERA
jgi:alpha,alpha-trehalose phosphorylase